MSDPFQLRTPFSSGQNRFGQPRPGLLGDQNRLRLDPEIEAEMNAIRRRLAAQRLQAAWANPNWLAMHLLAFGSLTPPLSTFRPSLQPPTTPPWLRYTPPPARPPLVPRGNGPDTPREADMSDLLGAVWKIPLIQQASTRLTDQITDDLWRRRSTGERALIVTWGTIIAGSTIAGILAHRESRIWALDRINGQDISIPGVDGFSFRLHTRDGALTGGGATIGPFRGVTVSGGVRPHDVPGGGQIQDYSFSVQLNLLEAIPGLRPVF